MHARGFRRRVLSAEGARRGFERAQFRGEPARGLLSEAGTDASHVGETPAAIDARKQGPELSFADRPAADDHFMPRAALGLEPGVAAPGAVGRIEALRDHAFQRHAAGGLQDRLGAGLEMLDIPKAGRARSEQFRQALLAIRQRRLSQVLAVGVQQVEHEVDEVAGLFVDEPGLQCREARHAALVQGDDLAVEEAIGQRLPRVRDFREAARPVESLARAERGRAAGHAHLHPVAVELDLVPPAGARRHEADEPRELGRDELRRVDAAALRLRDRAPRSCGRRGSRGSRAWRLHEGSRPGAAAGRDVGHAPSRGDRAVLAQERVAILLGKPVPVLDQSQLLRLPPSRSCFIRTRTHSPFRRSPSSRNFRLPALSARLRGDSGQWRPEPAIPELHGAAAVLALRDRAFEVAVVERMVLDLDRKPPFAGVE